MHSIIRDDRGRLVSGADGDRAYPWGAWFNLPLTIFRTKKFLRANDAAPRPQHERTQLAETQNPKQARRQGLWISVSSHRTDTFRHRTRVVGTGAMFGTDTKFPIVKCSGCELPMKAIERKPVAFSNGLVDVTFVCEACQTHTICTIKPGDKGLL